MADQRVGWGSGIHGSEAAFKACLRRGVQPTIGIRSLANRYGFNRDLFTYVPERDLYICPEGKELHRLTDNPQFRQSVYRPARGTCQNCPLKANCAPGRSDRHIIRRWETALWEELEEHLKSRHARSLMRRRRVVSERTFADAKTKHGLDRAQFRGRVKMRIQALLTASAMNLRQLVKRQPVAQAGMAAQAAPWRPVDVRILAIQRLGALVATLHEALGRRSGLRTSLVVN